MQILILLKLHWQKIFSLCGCYIYRNDGLNTKKIRVYILIEVYATPCRHQVRRLFPVFITALSAVYCSSFLYNCHGIHTVIQTGKRRLS